MAEARGIGQPLLLAFLDLEKTFDTIQGAVSRTIVKHDSVSYGKKPITDDIRNSENAFLQSSVCFPS